MAALCQSTPMCKDPLCFLCMLIISTSLLTLCLRQLTTCECTGKSVRVSELKSSPGSSCSRATLIVFSASPGGAARSWGASGRQPVERQKACGGTHALPTQRQLHVPLATARGANISHCSTPTGAAAHTGHSQGPIG